MNNFSNDDMKRIARMCMILIFISVIMYIMSIQAMEIQQQQINAKQQEWEDFKESNPGEIIGDLYVIHGEEKEKIYAVEEANDNSNYYVIWIKHEDGSIESYDINKKYTYLYSSNSDNTYICKGTAYYMSKNIGITDCRIYDLYLSDYDLKKLSGQLDKDEQL